MVHWAPVAAWMSLVAPVIVLLYAAWRRKHNWRRRRPKSLALLGTDEGKEAMRSARVRHEPQTATFRNRLRLISGTPLFRRFRRADHPLLLQAMDRQVWAANDLVMKPGDQSSYAFWIIESGSAMLEPTAGADAGAGAGERSPCSPSVHLRCGECFGLYNSKSGVARSSIIRAGPDGLSALHLSYAKLAALDLQMLSPRRKAVGVPLRRGRSKSSVKFQEDEGEDDSGSQGSGLSDDDKPLSDKSSAQRDWLLSVLREHLNPIFGLSEERLALLAESCELRQLEAHEQLIVQDNHGELMHLVESGRLRATTSDRARESTWDLAPDIHEIIHGKSEFAGFSPSRFKPRSFEHCLDDSISARTPRRRVLSKSLLEQSTVDTLSDSSSLASGVVLGPRSALNIVEAFMGAPSMVTLTAEEQSVVWSLSHAAIKSALYYLPPQAEVNDWNFERQSSLEDLICDEEPVGPPPSRHDLEHLRELGAGANGTVSLVRHVNADGSLRLYALKSIPRNEAASEQTRRHLRNELEVMGLIDTKFIVRLLGAYRDKKALYFLLEPALGGDLFKAAIEDRDKIKDISEFARFSIASVALALQHMHSRKVIYRDLKPENVLLNSAGNLKVCDFGFAKLCLSGAQTMCGTPEYMAPEVVQLKWYNHMVDWWSLGVMTYELLSGRQPFCSDVDPDNLVAIFNSVKRGIGKVRFSSRAFSVEAEAFVRALCAASPADRLCSSCGVEEVRRHKFFAAFNWRALALGELQAPYQPDVEPIC